jgi:dynein heavy chain
MQMEPQDAAEKLRLVLKVLGTFKSYYLEYKARSAQQAPANPWRVQNGALFGRLDAFLARCQDVLELCNSGQEVGGRVGALDRVSR